MLINDSARRELARRGVQCPGVVDTDQIHPDTTFACPSYFNGQLVPNSPVTVGAFTLVNGGDIQASSIGRYCSIAADVVIAPPGHATDRITTSPVTWDRNLYGWADYMKSVGAKGLCSIEPYDSAQPRAAIEHDVWIGNGAFIKAGVKIGLSSIVAARACVVKDVEPFSIVAGVPARVVKMRFVDELRERLLATRWWEYSIGSISGLGFRSVEETVSFLEIALSGWRRFAETTVSKADIERWCEAAEDETCARV